MNYITIMIALMLLIIFVEFCFVIKNKMVYSITNVKVGKKYRTLELISRKDIDLLFLEKRKNNCYDIYVFENLENKEKIFFSVPTIARKIDPNYINVDKQNVVYTNNSFRKILK